MRVTDHIRGTIVYFLPEHGCGAEVHVAKQLFPLNQALDDFASSVSQPSLPSIPSVSTSSAPEASLLHLVNMFLNSAKILHLEAVHLVEWLLFRK